MVSKILSPPTRQHYGVYGSSLKGQTLIFVYVYILTDFPHPSRPALGSTQPPVQWVPDLSRGGNRSGRGADHPPPSKCRGHERVELYLYSPSGPSWPVLGRPLPLPLYILTGYSPNTQIMCHFLCVFRVRALKRGLILQRLPI